MYMSSNEFYTLLHFSINRKKRNYLKIAYVYYVYKSLNMYPCDAEQVLHSLIFSLRGKD